MSNLKKEIKKLITCIAVLSMGMGMAPTVYAEDEEVTDTPEPTVETTIVEEVEPVESLPESTPEIIEIPEEEETIPSTSKPEVIEEVEESTEEPEILPSKEAEETPDIEEETTLPEESEEPVEEEPEPVETAGAEQVGDYEPNLFGETLKQNENGEYELIADTFGDAIVVRQDSLMKRVMRLTRKTESSQAAVSDFRYLGAYTGTAPFDANDDAGNDSSQVNGIVRSYDKVVYRTSYAIDSSDGSAITSGTLHFEATLPVSKNIATWDLVSMGWLQSPTVTENENGTQTLNGTVTFSGGQIAPRIGVINWVISVNSAGNGTVIDTPSFRFWINEDTAFTYAENTNPVTISAKTNVDAGIVYYGKNDAGQPQWLVTTSLMSLPIEKGIKGQQLPDASQSMTITFALDNGMEFVSAVNVDEDARGGTVTGEGTDHYSLTISDLDFTPFAEAVVNNTAAYTMGNYLITTTAPMDSRTLRSVSNTITQFKVMDQGGNLCLDINAENNIAQYEDGGTAVSTDGGAEYGPVNAIYAYRYDPTVIPVGINSGVSTNAIDYHETNTASGFKDDGALKVNVGDFVNFNIVEYSEQKLWKDTLHGGVNEMATFVKLDGSIYDFASAGNLKLQDAAGFRVAYSIDETNQQHAEAVWSSAKNTDYAYSDPNTKLYYAAKKDGSNWSSETEMLDARFSASEYELFENTADLQASGKELVGFYVTVKDMTAKMDQSILGMSQPVVRIRIATPYLILSRKALVDDAGNLYAKDDPTRVHVIAVDSEYTMKDGTKAAHYSSSAYQGEWSEEGLGRFNVTKNGGFQKAVYDANGLLVSPSRSDMNYWSSDYDYHWQVTNDVNFVSALGGTTIYPNEYSFAIQASIVQQTNGTMKNVFNLDLGQRVVDLELKPQTLPVPMNVRNEPIYILCKIPEGLHPVHPDAQTVEEKWGVSYDGEALQDPSVNGGAGVRWEETVPTMDASANWDDQASYSVYEQENTIVWELSNYQIGHEIPKINLKAFIGNAKGSTEDVESNAQMEIISKMVNNLWNPTITAQSSTGLTTIRMGGAILQKTAEPAIRTYEDNQIAFDVSYTDQGVLNEAGHGKVGVIDVLPYDDGKENAGLQLGDYLLTNVKFDYTLRHIDGSVSIPSMTFYYTDADPKTLQAAEDNFLTEDKLYDFAGWESVNVTRSSQVEAALLNKHITAIGWIMHNAGDGSYANVHYEYRWEDPYENEMHRWTDDLYNTAVMAGEDGVLQRTEAKAGSISNVHLLLIDYLEKGSEAVMWKRYVDPTKDKNDKYRVESPTLAGYHLVDMAKDAVVSGTMPNSYHHIKVYYERNIIAGSLVTVYQSADPASGTKVKPGDTITYSFNAINTGAFDSTEITITDPIPVGTTYVSSSDGGKYEDGKVTWTLDPLTSGSSKTVTMTVKVIEDMEDKVVYSVAVYRTEDDHTERETVVTQHPLGKAQGGTILEAVKGASATTVSQGTDSFERNWSYTGADETYVAEHDGVATFNLYGAQSGDTNKEVTTRNRRAYNPSNTSPDGMPGADYRERYLNYARLLDQYYYYHKTPMVSGAYGGYTQAKFEIKEGDEITIRVGEKGQGVYYEDGTRYFINSDGTRYANNNGGETGTNAAHGYPKTGRTSWSGTWNWDSRDFSDTGWYHGITGEGGYTEVVITRNGNVVGRARANGGGRTIWRGNNLEKTVSHADAGFVSGGTAIVLDSGASTKRTGNGAAAMTFDWNYNEVKNDVGTFMDADITDGTIHYIISINNVNPLTNHDVVLVDQIPSGTTYVEGSAGQNGTFNQAKNRVEWYVGDLKFGETRQYTFDVKLDFTQTIINNQAFYAKDVIKESIADSNPQNKTNIVQHVIQGGMTIMKRWVNDDATLEERPDAIDVVIRNLSTSEERTIPLKASEGWQAKINDIDTEAEYSYWEKKVPDGYETTCTVVSPCKAQKAAQTFLVDFSNSYAYSIIDAVKEVKNANGDDINEKVVKEGSNLYYEITVNTVSSNTKDTTLTITDQLPFGTTFVSAEQGGTYNEASNVITWNIPVKGKKKTIVRFTAKTNGESSIVINKAKVRFGQNELETNETVNYLLYVDILKNLPVNRYDIWGEPSFLFKITDEDGKAMYQVISIGKETNGRVHVNLPHEGVYTIEEMEDVRYKWKRVEGLEGTAEVVGQAIRITSEPNQNTPQVRFTNEPFWSTESHETTVINRIHS